MIMVCISFIKNLTSLAFRVCFLLYDNISFFNNILGGILMVKVAVVGATGVVGSKLIEMLEHYEIKYDELVLFASKRSSGKEVSVGGQTYVIQELTEERTQEKFDYVVMKI